MQEWFESEIEIEIEIELKWYKYSSRDWLQETLKF